MLDAATDLDQEREYVATLYTRLDELRDEKIQQLAAIRKQSAAGSHQNRSERDSFATMYEDRIAQLNAVDDRLVFGRLDLDSGDQHYIGRIGLSDEELEPLLIDWRAPEASAFYQATALNRQGVQRRRHLILQRREVKAIQDEVLDTQLLADESASGEQLHGEGALMAALEAKRTGQMGDIIATIQAEQDRIVRAPLAGALVVQGGPGTGKTAVALHRAAYLLYTNRKRLGAAGVLLVGPSTSFMRYIERVLPSLGETGVVMSSLGGLMPGVETVPESEPQAAEIKGRAQMVEVIAAAVRQRQRVPQEDTVIEVNGEKLTLTPKQFQQARDRARASGKPHNQARLNFLRTLLRELTDELTEKVQERSIANLGDLGYLAEDVRSTKAVRVALNLAWMPLTPEKLLADLFAKPELLAAAAPELSDQERALLYRDPQSPWTEVDVPLLDEAAELLGEADTSAADAARQEARRRELEYAERALANVQGSLADAGVDGVVSAADLASFNSVEDDGASAVERAESDRSWTYGHIVVDEAQELSYMQWRLLTRRCPMKSFTIVGDIAQTSALAGASSWRQALEPHFTDRWTMEELTVNYRTPAQIAELAAQVAQAAGQQLSMPRPVREGRWAPVVERVSAEQLPARITAAVAEEAELLEGGLLGVIAHPDRVSALKQELQAQYPGRVGSGSGSLEHDIVVLDPVESKGLEFDGVLIIEPGELVSPGRVGDLYVAMTRATQRLHIVGAGEFPAGLEVA